MIVEILALAAVTTWLVLLPLRAAGLIGPRRGSLRARPAARPATLAPALPELATAPQRALTVDVVSELGSVEPSDVSVGRPADALVGAGAR